MFLLLFFVILGASKGGIRMKKVFLFLGILSSLTLSISLQGRGLDNPNCSTFGECLSENLADTGGGGNAGNEDGSGGGSSIPLPPSYGWKPIFTDAQFQIFCDTNRVTSLPYYDPNYVTNNGGILCFETNSSAVMIPSTQKSPNFIIGGLFMIGGNSAIFDYYSALIQKGSKKGTFIENVDGFKFFFIEDSSSNPLYLYDFRNDSYTPLFVKGFMEIYDSQVTIYCDSNKTKRAKAVIQSPPKSQINYRYIYLAHKCNNVWTPFMLYINDSLYYAYNYAFILRDYLPIHIKYSSSELKAIPLNEIGKCIEKNTKYCFLDSTSNNFKTVLNFTTLDEFFKAKIKEENFNLIFNLRGLLPDINDGNFVVVHHGNYYVPHFHYPVAMYAVSKWIPYSYFETDENLTITGGYLSVLALSSYSLVKEQNNYCVYEYKDTRGFTHKVIFNKILTGNSCPISVSLNKLSYYGPGLYALASNKGTILVIGSIGANGGTYTFLGILYPDTSQVDGYYLTKIPFYPSSILKIYMLNISKGNITLYGGSKLSLIRVKGKDYFKLEISNLLLYSPQFNRSDVNAERY